MLSERSRSESSGTSLPPPRDWEGRERRKKSPHKSSQPCKPRQHKGPRAGAEPGGWAGARSAASPPRPARRAQRAPSCPPRTPRRGTAFRWGLWAHAWSAPGCRAPRTAALPGRPRAAPGSGSVSARSPVCRRGRPSGRSRARAHLCAFSRAARGGERRRPRWASPARPLQLRRLPQPSGTPGGGRFALLLIHEAATRAGDWAAGRCARPASAGTDTLCRRLTPLGAHVPASALAARAEWPGWVPPWSGLLGPLRRPPHPHPAQSCCPSSKPGLLWQQFLGAFGQGTVFAGRAEFLWSLERAKCARRRLQDIPGVNIEG